MLSFEFQISNKRSADIHKSSGRLYWERTDEIFCKMKFCPMKIRHEMVPLKKQLKLQRFLLFQKRSILLESAKSSPLIGALYHARENWTD